MFAERSKGNRPDLEGNDGIGGSTSAAAATAQTGTTGEAQTNMNATENDAFLRGDDLSRNAAQGDEMKAEIVPYTTVGEGFTKWLNERLRLASSPVIMLGTKRATVIALHADGRFECELEGDASPEPVKQMVAFDAKYLDSLIPRVAVKGQ